MLLISLLLAALFPIHRTAGDVVVFTGNSSLTFKSTEASFVPAIGGSGMSGILMQANPADACSTLDVNESSTSLLILLTMRGNCSFDLKVLNAQSAGFSAIIIYANDYSSTLLTMAGNPEGIHVHAVYVTRESGEALLKYAEDKSSEIWLSPSDESSLWSIEVLLCAVVLAVGAALATWLITKNRKVRRLCSRLLKQKEPCVMRSHIVQAMPSITYRVVAAGDACRICLEDYKVNQNLRILPCKHSGGMRLWQIAPAPASLCPDPPSYFLEFCCSSWHLGGLFSFRHFLSGFSSLAGYNGVLSLDADIILLALLLDLCKIDGWESLRVILWPDGAYVLLLRTCFISKVGLKGLMCVPSWHVLM